MAVKEGDDAARIIEIAINDCCAEYVGDMTITPATWR
jgi:hypothetical protein